MNRPIRRVGVIMLLLYTILFGQLNNLQLFGAPRTPELRQFLGGGLK